MTEEMNAIEALTELDTTWFNTSLPRWMDAATDYAGQELFVIDADALLSYVLEDELLALARPNNPAFALLHAKWLLEKTLKDLKDRDCTFHLALFNCNRHLTLSTGEKDRYVGASRMLARNLLVGHLRLVVGSEGLLEFEDLEDEDWLAYYHRKKPMFILTSDGGLLPESLKDEEQKEFYAARILNQRHFVFMALHSNTPIVLLKPAEFKDGKIMTYVAGALNRTSHMEPSLLSSIESAQTLLNDHSLSLPQTVTPSSPPKDLDDFLVTFAKTFLSVGSTEEEQAFVLLYLLHILVLPSIPLSSRAQYPLDDNTPVTTLLTKVYGSLASSLECMEGEEGADQGFINSLDLDGSIFIRLAQEVFSSLSTPSSADTPSIFEALVGSALTEHVTTLWSQINSSLPVLTSASLSKISPFVPSGNVPPSSILTPYLPFTEPTFTPLLSSIRTLTSSSTTSPSSLPPTSAFLDTPAFVQPKAVLPTHLGGPPPVQLNAREKKKKDRKDQRYYASMQKSAMSLTGAEGKGLKREVITAVGRLSKGAKEEKGKEVKGGWNAGGKSGGKVKEKVLSSKDKLLAENAAKKQAEASLENATWWTTSLATLKPLALSAQLTTLSSLLKNRRSTTDANLFTEITLKKIDTLLRLWIADEKREEKDTADEYKVLVVREARDLLDKMGAGLSEKQGKAAVGALDACGLGCLIKEGLVFGSSKDVAVDEKKGKEKSGKKLKPGQGKKEDKKEEVKKEEKEKGEKLTFSFVSLKKSGEWVYPWMGLGGEDPLEWQLRCMGEWMVRSLDSKPDSRVSFDPDKWQRDVLDLVDRDESMLVVAPTSSGKTFISFAAMEKTLRDSDDGVCVYVAPTKALVNQVAAEVFARFSKDVPNGQMWSIATPDYRINNPSNCQILVTVPHVLSRMLLDPSLAKVWTPRLRRVILDEIHSISDEDGAAIWEQVLLLNPAPIIGLSATVGAPERFAAWLESVERQRGRKFTLIQHTHRFNALRKFAYAPSFPIKPLNTLADHKSNKEVFAHIHPISALALGDPNLPEDLSLEPRDTLSLWQTMTGAGEVDPKFTPSTYFASTPSIAIRDVIRYEKDLKQLLVSWMETPGAADDPSSSYRKVVAKLEGPLRLALGEVETELSERENTTFHDLILPLLADLNAQGQLPAILFNWDRTEVEKIAERLLHDLEDAESRWKEKSPEWKRKLARAKEAEKLAQVAAKAKEAAGRNKKDEEGDGGRGEDQEAAAFDPDAPAEEFSFVGKGISHVEFKKEVDELAWLNLPSWLINAMRRGIGVHHAGLSRRYRTLVENLYRRGILRVVISTGTLALGVNAPARTTVFAGDSLKLTPLQYRQAAGRAGRRGFDTLGNVVFLGVSLDRIQRLFLSRLPKLGGTFPLSATLVLRLHNLLRGSESAPLPVEAVASMLSLPQLSVGNETGSEQTKFFVRATIEYLRRVGLLDEEGRPMNLYGLISTLYSYEPSNFAFAALLRSGELHRLTRNFTAAPEDTVRSLLIVLANLFARVPRRAQSTDTLQLSTRNSSSVVILPQAPPRIAAVLQRHNEAVTSIFSNYVYEFSRQQVGKLPDNTLPLSGVTFDAPESEADGTFLPALSASVLPSISRSPFVASSGHGDRYASVKEISTTTRSGVILTTHAVPALAWITSSEHQLDAYILDFFRHGSLDIVVRDNSVPRADIWFCLQDFDIAITAIQAALQKLILRSSVEREDDNDSDDGQDQEDDEQDGTDLSVKPANVDEADWLLFQAVTALQVEFRTKFLKIFA